MSINVACLLQYIGYKVTSFFKLYLIIKAATELDGQMYARFLN
jgi:hypothetical protein